jgi:hypothetical protein
MQSAFGAPAKIGDARASITSEFGQEQRVVLEETLNELRGLRTYYRDAQYSGTQDTITMSVTYSSKPQLEGLRFKPFEHAAESPHESYKTKTRLRLPFQDAWFVVWGGRSVRHNYHAATRDQRFALDLLIALDGSTHSGDGSRLEDYHCFGRPILAPGAGRIVTAVGDLRDNLIGETDRDNAAGNHVVIDHGNGEFSVLAHLKQGSLVVKAGMRVEAGARLGLCGNSGNTSEPHLHYHLQDGPTLFTAAGLPAQFQRYDADGTAVVRGEPRRGQTVKN